MPISETHMQFLSLLERLEKIRWNRQFQILKQPEFCALQAVSTYQRVHPEVPGIYVSDLASDLQLTMPTASKLLKGLEQRGWLRRTVDPKNRRNTFVSLTPEGQILLEEEREHSIQMANRVFQRLGKENTAVLLQSLEGIIGILEEEFR